MLCLQGLEAQLLGIVVRKERPELEEQKDSLVISIASGRRRLQELEDEILRLSSNSDVSLVLYTYHYYILYLVFVVLIPVELVRSQDLKEKFAPKSEVHIRLPCSSLYPSISYCVSPCRRKRLLVDERLVLITGRDVNRVSS